MRERKRVPALLLAALILLLAGCGGGKSAYAGGPEELAAAAVESQGRDPAALERLDAILDPAALEAYIESYYGLTPEEQSGCAIYRAGGAEAFEIAVLSLTDGAEEGAVRVALEAYIHAREGDFTGYAPAEAEMIAASEAIVREGYALLLICPAPELARETAEALLAGGTPPTALPAQTAAPTATPEPTATAAPTADPAAGRTAYVPPHTDDMTVYDTSAILAAWAAGDPSGLGEYDRAIYDAAAQVLDSTLSEGMSDYDKERALYGWITWNLVYDWAHQDPLMEVSRDSYGPYGGLVAHRAVCLGVASSFQLLMDMAGVECIIVPGASYGSTEDHAWNMVRLEGEWYCADPTWDLYDDSWYGLEDAGQWGPEYWDYFNVTSDRLAQTDHQWDYAAVPEATATRFAG